MKLINILPGHCKIAIFIFKLFERFSETLNSITIRAYNILQLRNRDLPDIKDIFSWGKKYRSLLLLQKIVRTKTTFAM